MEKFARFGMARTGRQYDPQCFNAGATRPRGRRLSDGVLGG